jgi:hypothetical protein
MCKTLGLIPGAAKQQQQQKLHCNSPTFYKEKTITDNILLSQMNCLPKMILNGHNLVIYLTITVPVIEISKYVCKHL